MVFTLVASCQAAGLTMASIEDWSLLTLPSQCAFCTHVRELVFICGLGHFNCDVGPDFFWRRALEHSLSVALCLPSLLASHCALLSPEVRWSEMEWLVSLVLDLSALSCEMNGLFYTSIVSIEMNVVVSTSVVRRFEGGFLPWVHCYFVGVQY